MKLQASLVIIFVALATPVIGLNSYISIGRCDEWEQEEFERKHLDCTRQVEERYSLILERFDVDLPLPLGTARNKTKPPFQKTQVRLPNVAFVPWLKVLSSIYELEMISSKIL